MKLLVWKVGGYLLNDKIILYDLSNEESGHFIVIVNRSDKFTAKKVIARAKKEWKNSRNYSECDNCGYGESGCGAEDLFEDCVANALKREGIEFCLPYYSEVS